VTTDSALRHGAAAFLRGEIPDVRHWGAMAAPFNASRGGIREACADAEQMNCIREMVVLFDGDRGGIYVAIHKWQRHLESLTTVW